MKLAELLEAAMEWTVTIEGQDEYGEVQRAELRIEKGFDRLVEGEIGLSIPDGKQIMTTLQELVVKQELALMPLRVESAHLASAFGRSRTIRHEKFEPCLEPSR
jgi:hypothetical protein